MDDGGFTRDTTQLGCSRQELVVEDKCSSHMHKYGDFMCIRQGPRTKSSCLQKRQTESLDEIVHSADVGLLEL